MSEQATPTPAAPAPGSDQVTPAAAATVVPEGYVPAAEVDAAREEGRRAAQAEYDRRRAAEAVKPAAPVTPVEKDAGSDLDAFRRQLLSDVYGAASLSNAAEKIRAEFPHADPGLFAPEKLSQFSSPDALRFAAQDSHKRVADILTAREAEVEKRVREELAAAGVTTVTPAGHIPAGGGDPTPAQMAVMSVDALNTLEKANPGVVERVLLKAGVGA